MNTTNRNQSIPKQEIPSHIPHFPRTTKKKKNEEGRKTLEQ